MMRRLSRAILCATGVVTVLVAGHMGSARADLVLLPAVADGAKRTQLTSTGEKLFVVTEHEFEMHLVGVDVEPPFASTTLTARALP